MADSRSRKAFSGDSPQSDRSSVLRRLSVHVIAFPLYALSIAFLLGIVAWGGFNWSMEATNQESFCISCHVMRDCSGPVKPDTRLGGFVV